MHQLKRLASAAALACVAGLAHSGHAAAAPATPSTSTAKAAAFGFVNVTHGTVVANVSVVDTRTGWISPFMAVVVDQGKITRVLPTWFVTASGSARVVDGTGKYIVPGYLDMHTHAVPASFGPAPIWPLFIANGVTGIRDMAGAPPLLAAVKQYNAARAAGTLVAPQILQMPGIPVAGAFGAAEGVAAVQQTKAMGGSFVKVVQAFPEALSAILQEAARQGLAVSGHLSPGLSAVATAQSGWKSIEHLGAEFGIQLDCATDQAAIRQALLSGQGALPPYPDTYTVSPFLYSAGDAPFVQRELDTQNAATCDTVADAIVRAGTWQVPTLIRERTMLQSDAPEFANDPNLRYVDPTTRALWSQLAQQFTALQPASAAATFRGFEASFVRMATLLHQHGGASRFMTGTDVGGIWVIPGFSLHQEFRELAGAGFSPLEVLQATTLNGATYLGRLDTMGTVEAGKNADLVLLDANPLFSVANLSLIAGVFNAGSYFSKSDLDAMKAAVAQTNAQAPIRDFSELVDRYHHD